MEKQFYIVQYNDCYGNGDDKAIEGLIESKEDFDAWLEQHNKERDITDDEVEFDLIPIILFTNKK